MPQLFENSIKYDGVNCDEEAIRSDVSQYYGKVLSKSEDLKTNACCTSVSAIPDSLKRALKNISEEVSSKYYGCGLVFPEAIEGLSVLDLGCGAGRDCFVISQMVGPSGKVVGVDMTLEQLDVANKNIDWHTQKFGYEKSNVEFKLGFIEKLDELGLEPGSFDIVISNCVINLSPDKEAVLRHVYRLLKPGGEFYFSDVYSSQRVPNKLRRDEVLWGECISGALYWNDFLRLSKMCGFKDPRLVEDSEITVKNSLIQSILGGIKFYSATYRLWKIEELDSECEDYGQAVVYNGGIEAQPDRFRLDSHHVMLTGKVFPVCGNTFRMLKQTRFEKYFTFIGDFSRHYGIFEGCGNSIPFSSSRQGSNQQSSCC